jgi:hypothetical protein
MVEEFDEEVHLKKFRAGITSSGHTYNKVPELKFVEGIGSNKMKAMKTEPVQGFVDNPWSERRPNNGARR